MTTDQKRLSAAKSTVVRLKPSDPPSKLGRMPVVYDIATASYLLPSAQSRTLPPTPVQSRAPALDPAVVNAMSAAISRRRVLARSALADLVMDDLVDWDRIHYQVQHALNGLWSEVANSVPSSLSKPGRMGSKLFPLFSYRTFHRDSLDEDDPILAGVNIKNEGDCYLVTVDLSGEESGEALLHETTYAHRNSPALAKAVGSACRRLTEARGLLEEALGLEPT